MYFDADVDDRCTATAQDPSSTYRLDGSRLLDEDKSKPVHMAVMLSPCVVHPRVGARWRLACEWLPGRRSSRNDGMCKEAGVQAAWARQASMYSGPCPRLVLPLLFCQGPLTTAWALGDPLPAWPGMAWHGIASIANTGTQTLRVAGSDACAAAAAARNRHAREADTSTLRLLHGASRRLRR